MSTKLAAARRIRDGHTFYMIEPAIDVGCGKETVGKYYEIHMHAYNKMDQNITEVVDNSYACVHSAFWLQYMDDPYVALKNLIRISNKYIVITIPDEEMYEHNKWPSKFNSKWSFSCVKRFSFDIRPTLPKSISIYELLDSIKDLANILLVQRIGSNWVPNKTVANTDAECAIEIILEKKYAEH